MLPRAERGRERLATCAPMSLSTLATKLPFLLFYAIVLLQRTINTAKGQTFSKFCSSQAQILLIGNISEPGKRPSPYFQGHPTLEIPPQAITTMIKLEFELSEVYAPVKL